MKQLSLFETDNTTPQSSYLHLEGDIPIDLPEDSLISLQRKQPLKIHSLGFQPAKSIPEIPHWFLRKYGKGKCTILEPFAGSGTTIIETLLQGASIYWLDYHPLSRLICRVKTHVYDGAEILGYAEQILKNAYTVKHPLETINFANKDFWFQKPVQAGLESLRVQILQVPEAIQPLFWLVFASTVRKTSDMNDGMILAAKRANVKEIPQRSREDVYRYFKDYLDKALEAIGEWQFVLNNSFQNAIESNSKTAIDITGDWHCDAVITSPPYINAIDYVWASKFELHWLGLVSNDRERLDLYTQEIGTERITRNEYLQLGKTGISYLDHLIADIYYGTQYQASKGQNQLRARVVYKYFMDMKMHFLSCFNYLTSGGYYCFAIGDISKICGVEIPVAKLLTEIAEEIGFAKIFQFHLLLKNRRLNLPRNVNWAGTIKHDTVVVLQKSKT
ncbi:MAG: DNA methylase [Coleofasciculus sp. B1-GNL1-01]|uniref:DNA methylase n=1 Tax=Coleofasciculus sp. B1-GNL1-01 TaxID=3068484 RepID=UPI003303A5C7